MTTAYRALPVISAWDPRTTSSGSIDPLGALRPYTAIATTLLPGVTTITTRARYLSWICAGIRLLDETSDAPTGGRAGRERRRRLLSWERLVALACGVYAVDAGLTEGDVAWKQLRGVTYVRRAVEEGRRSSTYPMLRNQAGVGGVGTYWVSLVAGGLVADESATLLPRGEALAAAFLAHAATPERAKLRRVLAGADVRFSPEALAAWGSRAHLGAARPREKRLLADALLEPPAHRRMADAINDAGGATSEAGSFRRLALALRGASDPLADQLAAVLEVACAFEALHTELLRRFDWVRAADVHGRPIPVAEVASAAGELGTLAQLGGALDGELQACAALLPRSIATAVRGYLRAVQPTLGAASPHERVRALVRHHERVQQGKFDASRQPKTPWVELRGERLVVAPKYAADEAPPTVGAGHFAHPYRVEQFRVMLQEVEGWERET